MVPGDALKSLSQRYLSIPGCTVRRERAREERETERDRDRWRRGEELGTLPPPAVPLQTELEL